MPIRWQFHNDHDERACRLHYNKQVQQQPTKIKWRKKSKEMHLATSKIERRVADDYIYVLRNLIQLHYVLYGWTSWSAGFHDVAHVFRSDLAVNVGVDQNIGVMTLPLGPEWTWLVVDMLDIMYKFVIVTLFSAVCQIPIQTKSVFIQFPTFQRFLLFFFFFA